MFNNNLVQFTGWSAIASSFLSVIGTVTLMLMFAVNIAWGKVNDVSSVLWALTYIPIAILFYRLLRPDNPRLALIATIVGVTCLVAFAILQSALVIDLVSFEQTFAAVISMWVGVAFWLLISGVLARAGGALPPHVIAVMLLLSVSYSIAAVGFLSGGWESRLALIGFVGSAILGPLWGISLGRYLLQSGSLIPAGA